MEKITIKRGDTLQVVFTYYNPDRSLVDLTDCTARFHARYGKKDPVISESTTGGGIVIDVVEATVTVTVSATEMELIKPLRYTADLELTFLDGTVMSTPTVALVIEEDRTYD